MVARTIGRFVAFAVLTALAAGCGGNHYANPFQPVPSGAITLYFVGGGGKAIRATTKQSPVAVKGTFALRPSEPGYTDYFSAQVIWYSGNSPCYDAPSEPSNSTLLFPAAGGCAPSSKEAIEVSDTNGHSIVLWIVVKA